MTTPPQRAMTPGEPVAARISHGDLPPGLFAAYSRERRVAWDIETTGLDWQRDALGTCQLHAPDVGATVISVSDAKPARLTRLLGDPAVQKVFHHAPFDLRFMIRAWGIVPASIRCTKVASKLLQPHAPGDEHTLKRLTWRHLGVHLDKAPSAPATGLLANSAPSRSFMRPVTSCICCRCSTA